MSDLEGRSFIVRERDGQKYLVPADIHAEDMLSKWKPGNEVMLQGRRPRNPEHHRKFFALLKLALDNTEGKWGSIDDLLESLKHAVGYVTKIRRLTPADPVAVKLVEELSTGPLYIKKDGEFVAFGLRQQRLLITTMLKAVSEFEIKTKSISFAAMAQDKFEEFYDNALNQLADYLGWDPRLLRKEVEERTRPHHG